MDTERLKRKATQLMQKYKYAALVVCIGLVLMLLPSAQKQKTDEPAATEPTQAAQSRSDLAAELAQLLSQVSGAGKVELLLSVAQGEKLVYQFDTETSESDSSASERRQTVIITDADRNEQAILTQSIPPVYLGAVVLCQGADQPSVQLAIVEAVSKATGLGADRICVLKMK